MTTTMLLMARWLAVLAVGLFIASGPAFASAQPSSKSACAESCAQRCPCCISPSAPGGSPAPLAPTPPTRTAVAKDFQLIATCPALLWEESEAEAVVPSDLSAPHFSPSIPVFVRYCSFLL